MSSFPFLWRNSSQSESWAFLFSLCPPMRFSFQSFTFPLCWSSFAKQTGSCSHALTHPHAKMSSAHERNKGTGLRLQGAEAWPETPAPWCPWGRLTGRLWGNGSSAAKPGHSCFGFPPRWPTVMGESAGKGKGEWLQAWPQKKKSSLFVIPEASVLWGRLLFPSKEKSSFLSSCLGCLAVSFSPTHPCLTQV